MDDNFIHKNTKTISINAEYLHFADYVMVILKHKGIVLSTSKERLMKEGFTKKYNLTKLVYFEETSDVKSAIEREKQLKNWHRDWKTSLINQFNPNWDDLSEGF